MKSTDMHALSSCSMFELSKQLSDSHLSICLTAVIRFAGCRDKNIVQFYGACVSEGTLMMVTELMENGDLFSSLSDPERAPRLLWNRR